MANLKYIVLVVAVVLLAAAGVLWQEDDTPTITFTRPAAELPNADSEQLATNLPTEGLSDSQQDGLIASGTENAGTELADDDGTSTMVPLPDSLTLQSETLTIAPRDDVSLPSEDQLSDEELAKQIELARQQLAQVEAVNARKQAQVERAMASEGSAEQPLIEAELAYRIGGWRQAWRTGDAHAYFQFYSDNFKPNGGKNIEQWKSERAKRLNPAEPIDLTLEDFEVTFDEQTQRSLVTFKQFYKSGNYQDSVKKRLVLANEEGHWKIISEVSQ